jgi:signal transduction histidine kinase
MIIIEIAKVLVTEQHPQSMLPQLMSRLITALEVADAGLLLLYDAGENRLKVGAAHGYDATALARLRLAPGESMSGQVFESGQAELYTTPEAAIQAMASLSNANREIFAAATLGLDHPMSAICIPLSTAQAKVGVLVLENLRQPGSFTREDVTFLEYVADLTSLAIENARLREALHAAQAQEETNRLKAELVSILAHEMRTPLTSIKGYSTALLMEDASFPPETQREFLQFIDAECDTLQDLIHNLLESTIIDTGLMKLEIQPVLLPRLVKQTTDYMARYNQSHHILTDFPRDFPIVEADPDRIVQVLRNLLDNAIKYSPSGGLVVVRGEVHHDQVVISVADEGIGIAPEDLNRLFEKFFRAKSSLGRHVIGSGLGLPIALKIVESHGGRIWAESQLNQGTTLYFTLPIYNLDHETAAVQE